MLTQKVIVENNHGLHLRVAAKIAETCQKYDAHVLLCKDCRRANGCSVLDLLLLEAPQGTELHIIVNGRDEVHEAEVLAVVAGVFGDGGGI